MTKHALLSFSRMVWSQVLSCEEDVAKPVIQGLLFIRNIPFVHPRET